MKFYSKTNTGSRVYKEATSSETMEDSSSNTTSITKRKAVDSYE